jgi:NAD(P)-dependent dehydrogenase (short-subunit alcohol dehydrogenase family)
MMTKVACPLFSDIAGKRVVITGAASGIGRACADAFAVQGCRLVLNDLNPDALSETVNELSNDGTETVGRSGSISELATVQSLFEAADQAFGGVDVLINNAGISMNRPTLELSLDDWKRALDINLTSVFLCCTAAARRMLPEKTGVIINMASMYGIVAAPERLAYCVTKSGVIMLTKTLAIEWAAEGLRVNAIAPGYVQTALVNDLISSDRLDVAALTRRTPQRRLAQPQEIANAAVFLSSEAAGHITGQALAVDGGWTAYGYI